MHNFYKKYIVIFISLYIFIMGIAPFLFQRAIPIICENLSYNTSYNITIEQPRLRLNIIPVATISANAIHIQSKKNNDCYQIKDLNVTVRLLPLITGRLHINKLLFTDADASALLEKNVSLGKNVISTLRHAKIRCDYINIKNAKIKLYQPEEKQEAIYSLQEIYYKNNGRYLKLKVNGNYSLNDIKSTAKIILYLPKNNNTTESVINAQIVNLDISSLIEFFKNYLPKEIMKANGILDVNIDNHSLSAVMKNFEFAMQDKAKSIIFPSLLNINSELNLTGKNILIKNAEILSKNINTTINCSITDFVDKTFPNINMDIRINKSRIEDFIDMLPAFKTEDIDIYKLKKYKFYGDIIGNIKINGNLREPNVNGSVFINNGILVKPIPKTNGATIKLDFKGKYLNFEVTVPAGFGEKVWVNGSEELYNVKYADLQVWSTKNVNLSTVREKIVPLHEILNFMIGPVPIMDINGIGNLELKIKGNRKNPHIWGTVNFDKVTTYFYELPEVLINNAEANLIFEDENIIFKTKQAFLNGKSIIINGLGNQTGKFDFDVKTEHQNMANLYKAIKTSSIINDIKNILPDFDSINGIANLTLKVYGNIKDFEQIKFNENFFLKGALKLIGGGIKYNGIELRQLNGNVNFDNTNFDIDAQSLIGKSSIEIKALIKDKFINTNINTQKLNLKDIIFNDEKFKQEYADVNINLSAQYKGNIENIEYDKLNIIAQILDVSPNNKLKLSKGFISLKNGNLLLKDIKGCFADTKSDFSINIQANNIFSNPVFNGNVKLKDFELFLINLFGEYTVLPKKYRDYIKSVKFNKGKINLDAKITNNNINTSTNIGGIELCYLPLNLPIKVINGSIYIRKNYLGLNKINLMADELPVLIDGGINNLFTKPNFNLYINSKPKQNFIDKYINNYRVYPLKIKGDIVFWIKINGTKDDFDIKSETNLAKDSSIYYLGATIGDVENSIILNLDMNLFKQTLIKIRDFSYDKLIESQGRRITRLNQLKANGGIDIADKDLDFKNLNIKTSHPTDARIFNILFRMPNIKQGQFTSDLKINGKLSNPRFLGTFHIVETNIPFLDTTMKNLSFIFKDKTIEVVSGGEILGNDISFKGVLRNKLTPPYYIENAELYTKVLDFNYLTNKLKSTQIIEMNAFNSLTNFDVKNIIIKTMKLRADEIYMRNIKADDVRAVVSLNDKKLFNIDNFKFKIGNGYIDGAFSYNLINNNTGINLTAKSINANDIAIALFDLNNQIYGDLTGNLKLYCNGRDFNKCMETLNGDLKFNVAEGRMPKLGSLEYLLKAGNLVKGGITGLSINSVIDILTPLKTGDFSNIYGITTVKDGIAEDIEISTKGKDLSLFMTGSYNFANSEAQMEILGLLSKHISTMFGPVGNVSLNTLFNVVPGIDLTNNSSLLEKINKIPGIEFNSKTYRKFISEINGNINGENYVTSFKWIN